MDKEARRLLLHTQLETLFPTLGIFYRPPGDIIIPRPCIVYTDTQLEPAYASNAPYVVGTRFQITVLSDLPGLDGVEDILSMVETITINSNRSFIKEDIVHDVFELSVNSI